MTNKLIIDKNYKGLVPKQFIYEFDGNIVFNGDIIFRVPVFVKGQIKAGGYIDAIRPLKASDSIISNEHIGVNGFIISGRHIKAKDSIVSADYIEVKGRIETPDYIEANRHIIAGDWIKAGRCIKMLNQKTKELFLITGKQWPIWVMDKHIKIGCEFHSKEAWASFTDVQINSMGPGALEFWEKEKKLFSSL